MSRRFYLPQLLGMLILTGAFLVGPSSEWHIPMLIVSGILFFAAAITLVKESRKNGS